MTGFLYDVGIHFYAGAVRLVSMFNSKAGLLVKGHRGLWRKLKNEIDTSSEYIWIHAASLGEFEQGRPLIEKLRREGRGEKILLTFFSPSGYEIRKNYHGADIVSYLPFDTCGNVRKFLDLVRPVSAFFIKYEFWRNYLQELSLRGVPAYLISAVFREEQMFFKPYGKWYATLPNMFTHIFVQDEASRNLLAGIGMDRVTVSGDTRFDRVADVRSQSKPVPEIERFKSCGLPLLMVGSSWESDENIYAEWVNDNAGRVLTVIAPHEFSRQRLDNLLRRFNGSVLYSEVKNNPALLDSARVLIMDCFGLLSSAYRYADVVWVGGGFGAGIHNINEPAVFGVPVVFGPRHGKFIEAREMIAVGGGFCVGNLKEAEALLSKLFSDSGYRIKSGIESAKYIDSKLGATDRIYREIFGTRK